MGPLVTRKSHSLAILGDQALPEVLVALAGHDGYICFTDAACAIRLEQHRVVVAHNLVDGAFTYAAAPALAIRSGRPGL